MADSYTYVKASKLSLKGHKHKKHKKSKKRKHEDEGAPSQVDDDVLRHGGWWSAGVVADISGNVALELGDSRRYLLALDTGGFSAGPSHDIGEGPAPEEILTALRVGDNKVALKTGYGKYVGLSGPEGCLSGTSDAAGSRELWEPVFQEGRMALSSCTGKFLSFDGETVTCTSHTAGTAEMMHIRTCASREKEPDKGPVEEQTKLVKDTEINYVKKFQSWQDRKLRVNEKSTTDVKRARKEGDLHEVLLDRREKMKADRYCM